MHNAYHTISRLKNQEFEETSAKIMTFKEKYLEYTFPYLLFYIYHIIKYHEFKVSVIVCYFLTLRTFLLKYSYY